MSEEICFMPLGGGQSVGASCYFLRVGNKNIILDAGTGNIDGLKLMPDTYSLEVSEFIQSMGQIDYIFVSHAHMDHIGYLPELAKQAYRAEIFMTEMTASLTEYQLVFRQNLLVKEMLSRVAKITFMETRDLDGLKVTFLPAGHIPGAMMVLLEYNGKTILYTGDFSSNSTPLTDKCILPDNKKIDVLIACGLHAKSPSYVKNKDNFYQRIENWFKTVDHYHRNVVCQVNQLSKGVELLQMLNQRNILRDNPLPIYVDKAVENVVIAMERKNISIMKAFNHPAIYRNIIEPGIIITDKRISNMVDSVKTEWVDFSLHDDYQETKSFIEKINPESLVLVHVAPQKYGDCHLGNDGFNVPNTVYAEDGIVYRFN